jgi:intein-encoded DNA endonuclease-like protein
LGVLLGDGHVGRCTVSSDKPHVLRSRIRLKVCDYEFAASFYNALKKIGLRPHITFHRSKNPTWRDAYEVYAYSESFYDWYTKLTLDDIKKIVKSSKEHMIEFIRGIYESEGSITERKGYPLLRVISNANLKLVELVKEIVEELGFQTTLIVDDSHHRRRGWSIIYHLNLRGGMSTKFIETVNPVIKREPRKRRRGLQIITTYAQPR